MHIYTIWLQSFTKFYWQIIYYFSQVSKFKRGLTLRKNWFRNYCKYAHLHIMAFINGDNSKEKIESEFPANMRIYTVIICFLTTQFHEILFSGIIEVTVTKQDWWNDWLTDGSKTVFPLQLFAFFIIKCWLENDMLDR